MYQILGHSQDALVVAAKAVLLYVTAVLGFRLAARRRLGSTTWRPWRLRLGGADGTGEAVRA